MRMAFRGAAWGPSASQTFRRFRRPDQRDLGSHMPKGERRGGACGTGADHGNIEIVYRGGGLAHASSCGLYLAAVIA